MSQPPLTVDLDVAVIGGGVAGLWLLNRLLAAGYEAALFESHALGGEQTLASQGMIHGGIKYTLAGSLTGASEQLADMPRYWRACLAGDGPVDLSHTRILSEHFYLFSSGGMTDGISAFLASRLVHGRSQPVKAGQRPAPLDHPDFQGRVYQLQDLVLDVPSLVEDLAAQARGRLFKTDPTRDQWQTDGSGAATLTTATGARVRARQTILAAGRGNAALLEQLGHRQPAMQTRPLQQVLVRHPSLPRFYGHCLGAGSQPRLTISSHHDAGNTPLWYLGGALAEDGAHMSEAALIARAKNELTNLFPQLALANAQWTTLWAERAEPLQAGGRRPDGAYLALVPDSDSVRVAWPTKLTLAPQLAEEAVSALHRAGLQAHPPANLEALGQYLNAPTLAPAPWDPLFARERAPC